jgi:hypothetical protein
MVVAIEPMINKPKTSNNTDVLNYYKYRWQLRQINTCIIDVKKPEIISTLNTSNDLYVSKVKQS